MIDNLEVLQDLCKKVGIEYSTTVWSVEQFIDFSRKCYEQGKKDGYNQALEDIKKYILNSCNNVNCREDINSNNDFDFYASELLDMLEEIKK